jgi:hypothetical protein
MKTGFPARLVKSSIIWQLFCITIAISVFSLILLNRSPNLLRPISMSLRTGFGLIIPITALLVYATFRISGRIGELIAVTATMALFAFPLAGLWASGQTQSVVLSGLIPIADATSYYVDALRIMVDRDISVHSAMRPFFPGFLSVLLSIVHGNLLFSLAILSVIAGIACYLAAREIQLTHGAEVSVFFLILMFLYFRAHSGTVMSESLAMPVAALGIGLIWRGASTQKEWIALFGLTITALALNIRPGAMFILPAIICWGCWFFRGSKKFSLKFLLIGSGLVLIIFFTNSLAIQFLAGPSSAGFANFSWALYGLASGGNSWSYVFNAHPELRVLQEPEQSRQIYRLAFELITQNPALFIKGALFNWEMFFSNTWYNVFSYVSGENFYVNTVARYILYLLSITGFVGWLFHRNDKYKSLVALMSLGVLISVPFVPPTDAYRVRLYAATIPVITLLPSMGLAQLLDRFKYRHTYQADHTNERQYFYLAFVSIIAAVILLGPIFIRNNSRSPILAHSECPTEMTSISVLLSEGTYVNVLRENKQFLDWMPDYHQSVFRRSAHSLADTNLIAAMEEVPPPSALFYTLDYQSNQAVLVIAPMELLPEPGNYVQFCGYWDIGRGIDQYRVFYAKEAALK